MQTTLLNTQKLKVRLETGSEGPRYDPYSYNEHTIISPEGELIIHQGLAEWYELNGVKHDTYNMKSKEIEDLIVKHCGYTISQLERFSRRAKSRCPKCGGKDFHSESGYPGETFEVCDKCNHIVDSYFCRSAIE